MTKRILIIDDDTDIQAVAEMGLTLTTPWRVWVATSGLTGLELAAVEQPDVILLDVMMPEMDGLQILERLRSQANTCHIPVIFLTAKAQANDRRKLYAAGADGMITKPFDPTTLGSQIAGFLGWPLPSLESNTPFGQTTDNPTSISS